MKRESSPLPNPLHEKINVRIYIHLGRKVSQTDVRGVHSATLGRNSKKQKRQNQFEIKTHMQNRVYPGGYETKSAPANQTWKYENKKT